MMTTQEPQRTAAPAPAAITAGPPRVATLTANDRCDASSSERAYVAVTVNGTELLFCAHHYAAFEMTLAPFMFDAASVRDERWQLTEGEDGRNRDGVSA